jgi:hypothetical protein
VFNNSAHLTKGRCYMSNQLLNDREIAKLTSMSTGWVRNQRWRRKHNEEHSLTVDPIMIGTTPRYRLNNIIDWIDRLEATND